MTEQEVRPEKDTVKQNEVGKSVVDAAKRQRDGETGQDYEVLSTGYKAKLNPVSSSLIADAIAGIEEPEVPTFHNEAKGRDEPNPDDPAYKRAMAEYNRKRGTASLDAMIMFGVELVDGLPPDNEWIPKLRWMEKHGKLALDDYDLDDEIDKEYLFKKYIAVGNPDYERITQLSGVSDREIAEAAKKFRG